MTEECKTRMLRVVNGKKEELCIDTEFEYRFVAYFRDGFDVFNKHITVLEITYPAASEEELSELVNEVMKIYEKWISGDEYLTDLQMVDDVVAEISRVFCDRVDLRIEMDFTSGDFPETVITILAK
ncbi:MAG: hypothetical protein QXG57_05970 [Thermofilaceae archaeon]